jgi:DnaJ-class molecular chaperone
MKEKITCPKCNGNGFRMIWQDASQKARIPIDCTYCNNQGEVETNPEQEEKMKDIKMLEIIENVVKVNESKNKHIWSTLKLMYGFQLLLFAIICVLSYIVTK